MEHGGEFPDTMPQAIKMTDAEGRSCVYVPVTQDDKVVDSSDWGVRDARLASVPLSIRNRSSLALLIFMALLFRTRPPWPRQPRACVNGARYDIISLLGRSVTLVTFHSVDASEIDCCVPRGHGSGCGRYCCKSRKSNDAKNLAKVDF